MTGLKFLLNSLRNSAREGCEQVWTELRDDYASGPTPSPGSEGSAQQLQPQQRQPLYNDYFVDGNDGLETAISDELRLVEWSIGQGSTAILNNNNTVKLNNYQVNGHFDYSVIPYDQRRLAAERRQRDRTLVYEARYQELMQLLLSRVNCPVFRNFAWKEREEPTGELVTYVDKTYGLFSYIRGIGYVGEEKKSVSVSAVFDDGEDSGGGATLTEIFDDDDDMNVDDQSTRQTDDIIDDDSQTGDASIDEGSAGSGGIGKDIGDTEAGDDEKKSTEVKKKPKSRGKATTWTCHQCPKV